MSQLGNPSSPKFITGNDLHPQIALPEGATVPLAAQFDNDNSPASTAFVQRALGNLRGSTVLSASTVLNVTHLGKLVQFGGMAADVVATLPLASSCPDGTVIRIRNVNGSFLVTVSPQGSDVLGVNGGNGSPVLGVGDVLEVVSIGTSGWRSIGGSALLKYQSIFGASLAASGYQKLPSGLIIQWFPVTTTVYSNGFNYAALPTAFPSAAICSVISAGNISYGVFGCEIISLSQVRYTNSHTAAQAGYVVAIGY